MEKVDILPQVQDFCRRNDLLPEGGRVIVGLSGGPDSLALFDILHRLAPKYKYTLVAAHLNHGLRGADADADEAAVRCFCEDYNTRLYVRKRDIAAEAAANCQSEEEAGRRARYSFFDIVVRKEAMLMAAEKARTEPESQRIRNPLEHHSLYAEPVETQNNDFYRQGIRVAVGHHRNDQAETVLLNLGRGSGIDGLAGMRPQNGHIIRPLLPIAREKIEEYVCWRGLKPCLDATNLETNATRNRLRHQVIPAMSEAFGFDIVPSLARAARLLRQDADYLHQQAENALAAIHAGAEKNAEQQQLRGNNLPGAVAMLSIKEVNELHPAILSRVLRRWYQDSFGDVRDLSARQVAVLINLCRPGRSGRKASLPQGRSAVRDFDNLVLLEAADAANVAAEVAGAAAAAKTSPEQLLKIPGITELAGGDRFVTRFIVVQNQIVYNSKIWCFQASELSGAVVRYRRPRDYFKVEGRAHGKSLKKYFCERKVPAGLRDRLPLIARGDTILWIPGVGAAHRLPTEAVAEEIPHEAWVEVRYLRSPAPTKPEN